MSSVWLRKDAAIESVEMEDEVAEVVSEVKREEPEEAEDEVRTVPGSTNSK